MARHYIKITLAFAILISLLPLRIEKTPNTLTGYLFIFERPILSSLVVFVLLICGFLVYYPVPLGRNVIVYLTGYAAIFPDHRYHRLSSTIWAISGTAKGAMSTWAFPWLVMAFWLFALSRQGEEKRVVVGHHWKPGDEQRLLAQLEAINASLLRSGKKINMLGKKASVIQIARKERQMCLHWPE